MVEKIKTLPSNITAALVGGIVFVGLFLFVDIAMVISIVVSLLVYLIVGVFIFPKGDKHHQSMMEAIKKIEHYEKEFLPKMTSLSKKVRDAKYRIVIGEIVSVTAKIFNSVDRKQERAWAIKQFAQCYVESTIKILEQYLELYEHREHSTSIAESLSKVETMLFTIRDSFKKQFSAIISDELSQLNIEMAVLKESLELENL